MEEAGAETLLGDDKEHPAHDAASSLGILEGQKASFLPKRARNF